MGTYDTIVDLDNNVGLKCAIGHKPYSYQTKDIGGAMETFYIYGDSIYEVVGNTPERQEMIKSKTKGQFSLVSSREETLRISKMYETLIIYTSCQECLPVLSENHQSVWRGDNVEKFYPWVEYEINVFEGKIVKVTPVRVESRKDVRKKLPQNISDSSKLAQKIFTEIANEKIAKNS